jgi:hypothetical protein
MEALEAKQLHGSGRSPSNPAEDPKREILMLGAVDGQFYCRQWFPKAFRDPSPEMHVETWTALEAHNRYVSVEIFRGGAKTTLLRAFASKRIAYAESRTILYVSSSQDHAKRSVRWIRKQIQVNRAWAGFFKLKLGTKKTDEWLEIIHEGEGVTISIIAVGITGQTRGINLDDYRPDLIIVDDPDDEETTGTPDQRKKISDLFFGALEKSLAPPTESPNALMCLLQTPLQEDDLISVCSRDPQWKSLRFGCFDNQGKSRWEARFPTEFLMRSKRSHAARNQISLWLREMECKIVSDATSAFKSSWLKPWPDGIDPHDLLDEGARAFLWIDPVPPPSQNQLAKGLKGKDYEVLAVVVKYKQAIYLGEYSSNRGHDPDWTIMEFWRLVDHWRVYKFGVETVNYQRTLKWLLEKSMKIKGRYIQVHVPEKEDRRKKSYRIIDSLTGITSQGQFFVNFELHDKFISQYTAYPSVSHDDEIEAVSEATRMAQESIVIEGVYSRVYDDEDPYADTPKHLGACP